MEGEFFQNGLYRQRSVFFNEPHSTKSFPQGKRKEREGKRIKGVSRVGWVEERRRGAASRRVTQHFRRFVGFHFVQPNLHLSLTEAYWIKGVSREGSKSDRVLNLLL